MLVTLSGIDIVSKLLHPSNAAIPIDVTVSGIIKFFKLVQQKNVLSSIVVMP